MGSAASHCSRRTCPRNAGERNAEAHSAANEIVFRDFAQQAEMGRSVVAKPETTSEEHPCVANRPEFPAAESSESSCLPPKPLRDGAARCNSTLATFRTLPQPKSRASRPLSLPRVANPAKNNRPFRKRAQQYPLVCVARRFPLFPA